MLTSLRPQTVAAVLAAIVFSTSIAPHAVADNKSTAEQLFGDAKKLMDQGNAKDACPKLEESMRLDPADGTELRLATCYEMLGRYATAWGLFKSGLAKAKKAGNAQRVEFATNHLAAVEPKVSRVVITVDPAAKIPGLAITLDGESLGDAVLGTAIPVDPGSHKLAATAPGKKPFEATIDVVGEAHQQAVLVPAFQDAASVVTTTTTDGDGGRGWFPFALGGLGLALAGTTIASRFVVSSAQDARRDECATQRTPECDDNNVSKIKTWDRLSYVFGGLSVVALGAGIVLYATSGPSTNATKVGIGPSTIAGAPAFQIQGSF